MHMQTYETVKAWRCRRGETLRGKRARTHFMLGSLAFVLLLISQPLFSTSASAASVTEKYGELEEPGQIERRPVAKAAASPADSEEGESPDPQEAQTILPDSEAVDETIDDDPVPQPDAADAAEESGDEDDEVHPDEATTILPDSEAVDETIDDQGDEKPVASASMIPVTSSCLAAASRMTGAYTSRITTSRIHSAVTGPVRNFGVHASISRVSFSATASSKPSMNSAMAATARPSLMSTPESISQGLACFESATSKSPSPCSS